MENKIRYSLLLYILITSMSTSNAHGIYKYSKRGKDVLIVIDVYEILNKSTKISEKIEGKIKILQVPLNGYLNFCGVNLEFFFLEAF